MMKKKFNKFVPLKKRTKWLICSNCNIEEIKVDEDVVSIICGRCTQKLVEPPQMILKERQEEKEKRLKRPRGWQFMKEFVDSEGNVFYRGKEQPKLKGTLPTTIIEQKEKKSAFHKEQELIKKEKKLIDRFNKKKQIKKKKQLNKNKKK